MGGSSYRQDGNLHFDQSKFQKSKRLSSRTGSLMSANSANDDNISVESDLSNDAYVNLISANWGEQEGELRQAIYFQFIRKDKLTTHSFKDLLPDDDS